MELETNAPAITGDDKNQFTQSFFDWSFSRNCLANEFRRWFLQADKSHKYRLLIFFLKEGIVLLFRFLHSLNENT